MKNSKPGMSTLAVHAGVDADPATGARMVPIYQSAGYQFRDAKHAAGLFHLDETGFIYSRLTNPTVAALETKLAALEGGVGATACASGIAAHQMALFPLMKPGDEFIASNKLYGGTVNQLSVSFKHFGWVCHLVNPDDSQNFKKAITAKTKAIFIESVSNPSGVVADIEAIAKVAHEAGIPLIVDNTVPSPYLCRPFEHGADIVTHSTTKFLCGNGSTMGGAVVDSGHFDWSKGDKFPSLAKAEPSYDNRNFHKEFGEMAYTLYQHAVCLRDLGGCQAPMNAFQTILGMETLALRMRQHASNAREVAEFLHSHPAVSAVSYAGLKGSPYHALSQKYLPHGAASLFTFTLKAGYDACVAFVASAKLCSQVANIGDTRTLIIHPASTTHHQLNEEQMQSVGLTRGMIRLSVGIEDADDIIADLDQALTSASKKAA
jgi:O-acetylhomoserine (thiol)-lyase